MEFLESSRSARKMNPTCTSRYRRADPRKTNIILGCDKSYWETTNKFLQKQVVRGSSQQGKFVKGDRNMTYRRKRGMLDSTLSFGNAPSQWKTESKQHYHYHDLQSWGPLSKAQQDSYSWSEDDRRKLAALRDKNNADVSKSSRYMKLPPIYAKPGSQSNGFISANGDHYVKSNGIFHKNRKGSNSNYNDEDDI